MTKEELREKRNLAIENLNYAIAILGSDELYIDEIDELEKEIAELKEEMKAKQVVLNDFKSRVETVTNRLNKKASQLTKAKEHIRTLISCLIDWVKEGDKYYCHIADAEQFLKE